MCVCVCMHAWYSLFESVCTRGRGLLGWLHANTHLHTPRTWSFCANSSALVFPFASYPPLSSTQSGKRKKSASSPYSAQQAAHETCSNVARREKAHLSYMIEKAHLSYMIKRAPGQIGSRWSEGWVSRYVGPTPDFVANLFRATATPRTKEAFVNNASGPFHLSTRPLQQLQSPLVYSQPLRDGVLC